MTEYRKRSSGLFVPAQFAIRDRVKVGGFFACKLIRDGEVIDKWSSHNLVVNQGIDHMLNVEFCGGAQVSNWYLAPYSNNYAPTANDTATNISGSAGEVTAYTSTTRLPYSPTEGSQQVTNTATPATVTFNAGPLTIYGGFLISSPGKSSTSGVLWSATRFSTAKTVASGDQLLMTYVFSAAAS